MNCFKNLGIFCLLLLLSAPLSAADYYVSPSSGQDFFNGNSPTTAFRSLSRISGITLRPGDNVFLMNGTHRRPGQTVLVIRDSGTAAANITIQNYAGHAPVIEFDSWAGIELINGASYITFRGIKVKGANSRISLNDGLNQPGGCENPNGSPSGLYNGVGILAVGPNLSWSNPATTGNEVPSHITIEDCEVFDCPSSGIALQQADYVTVRNNKIFDNCWYTIYGTSGLNLYQFINTDGSEGVHNTITGNLFYGNELRVPQVPFCRFFDGNALIVDDFRHTQTGNYKDPNRVFPNYTGKTLIANNVAVENGGSGLHFFLSDFCYIYNNTMAGNATQNGGDNGNADLRVGLCNNFEVKNNILAATSRMHQISGNTGFVYTHNFQSGPGKLEVLTNCDGCVDTDENVFLNTNINDAAPYLTSASSLAADRGVLLPLVTDDYRGEPRTPEDAYDLGAYEVATNSGPCAESPYYLDADGDGFGDPAVSILACQQPDGYVVNNLDLCPDLASEDQTDTDGDGIGDLCEDEDNDGIIDTDDCDPNNPQIGEEVIFYADTDGDGFGDPENTVLDCTAPDGFVSQAGDGCPQDAAKTTPGQCGCGAPEDSCSDTNPASSCDAPAWQASTIYNVDGTQVTFAGKLYENRWYTSGTEPDQTDAWALIDICDGSTINCSTYPIWDAGTAYTSQGIRVNYQGAVYVTRYYSRGTPPDEAASYEFVGYCSPNSARQAPDTDFGTSQLSPELIRVYPTVVTDALTVENPTAVSLSVFDNAGRFTTRWELAAGRHELRLGKLAAGVYHVRAVGADGLAQHKRFIVR